MKWQEVCCKSSNKIQEYEIIKFSVRNYNEKGKSVSEPTYLETKISEKNVCWAILNKILHLEQIYSIFKW